MSTQLQKIQLYYANQSLTCVLCHAICVDILVLASVDLVK